MKKKLIAFLLLVTVCSFTLNQDKTANIKSFKWLQGSWQMQTQRGVITEKWIVANDNTLAGKSTLVRADGTEIQL